jgi:hypothetical protein
VCDKLDIGEEHSLLRVSENSASYVRDRKQQVAEKLHEEVHNFYSLPSNTHMTWRERQEI